MEKNLLDKPEVVADQDHSASIVVDSVGKRVNRFQVQMVSGFVQQQQMWALPG
jgi:hypothetical protein